jgi:hypothetical protein
MAAPTQEGGRVTAAIQGCPFETPPAFCVSVGADELRHIADRCRFRLDLRAPGGHAGAFRLEGRQKYRPPRFAHLRARHEPSMADRLRPGDKILFGDSMWSSDLDHRWRHGTVLFVNTRGGIRARTESGEEWIPYHYVLRKATPTARRSSPSE